VVVWYGMVVWYGTVAVLHYSYCSAFTLTLINGEVWYGGTILPFVKSHRSVSTKSTHLPAFDLHIIEYRIRSLLDENYLGTGYLQFN
jgi:hypothetical protein